MSNYVKATNFYSKDALLTGNPDKIIKGAEIDDEFNAIATAVATKADLNSPNFTGTPTVPTATSTTNTTQVASTAYVTTAIGNLGTMKSQDADDVDITGGSIVGITDLLPADGGTGVSSLTAKSVIIGGGTSPVTFVAPSTEGNVLTSDGTDWVSAAPTGGIGDGQTWQEVTRTLGTTYTNSTGKPIMLIGDAVRNAVSSAGLNCTINGVEVPLCYGTNSDGGNESVGSIIIPIGATYILTTKGESLSSYRIFELR
jgi:hypothetical protein